MTAASGRKRRRQARELTRAHLLEAAQAFLRAHPYRELTIEAVMAQSGYTRTVFYRHFDDLPDLILAVLERIGTELGGIGERWSRAIDLPDPDVDEGLGAVVAFFAREGRLVRAVAEAAYHDDEVQRAYGGVIEMFVAMTTRALQRLRDEGRTAPWVDPAGTGRALTLMNERYLLDVFGTGEPVADLDHIRDVLVGIWRGAVLREIPPQMWREQA